MHNLENSSFYADFGHPIDRIEPMDDCPDVPTQNSLADERRRAGEFIERFILWLADSRTLRDRGLRATAALWAIRPDLVDGATLEKLAVAADCDPQALHRLAVDFRATLGIQT